MALQADVSDVLMSIEVETFVRVFTEWKRRSRQCLEQGGDYLSISRFALLFLKLSGILLQVKGLAAPLYLRLSIFLKGNAESLELSFDIPEDTNFFVRGF
jgi:hypothetical protein